MIPRTVQMAKEVASVLSPTQLAQYGNIIGPFYKSWQNNYMQYYTQLPPNGYGVNPGDPTMFDYVVHSFTPQTGAITALGRVQAGQLYTPGTYTNVPTFGGSGTGATLNITVNATGNVTVATLNAPGSGYAAGDGLGVVSPGVIGFGYGLAVAVAAVSNVSPAGQPRWAQPPRRLFQNQVAPYVPPYINQQAIPYSAILYPSSM